MSSVKEKAMTKKEFETQLLKKIREELLDYFDDEEERKGLSLVEIERAKELLKEYELSEEDWEELYDLLMDLIRNVDFIVMDGPADTIFPIIEEVKGKIINERES